VAAQEADAASLLNRVRSLIKMRQSLPALDADAEFDVIYAESGKLPFVYTRANDDQRLLIAINPADRPASVEIAAEVVGAQPIAIDAPEDARLTHRDTGLALTLPPVSGAIYAIEA
jgi:glycosidase